MTTCFWPSRSTGPERRWPEADALASLCVLNVIALASALEARAEAWSRHCGIPSASAMQVLSILHGAARRSTRQAADLH